MGLKRVTHLLLFTGFAWSLARAAEPPTAVELSGFIKSQRSEEVLLSVGRAVEGSDDVELREWTRHALALRLGECGTVASLPYLGALERMEPRLTMMVPGCREPMEVYVHPAPLAAEQARHAILARAAARDFGSRMERGDLNWAEGLAALDPNSPEVAAARAVVASAPAEARARLIEIWSGEEGGSGTRGLLLAEGWLASGRCPAEADLALLDAEAALVMLRRADELPVDERAFFFERARANAAIASAAVLHEEPRAEESVAERLRRDGASAALAMAREGDVAVVAALEGLIADDGCEVEVRRLAVLSLMLRDDEAGRGALLRVLSDDHLDASLRRKVTAILR